MDAADFITIAGRVAGLGKAGARTAVSRAYYGLFHIARSLIEEFTAESYGSGRSHKLVPQFIESAKHPAGDAAAKMLMDLHSERIKADYRLHDESAESLEFAKVSIETALQGSRLLEHFRADCHANTELVDRLKAGVARVKSIHRA